MSRSEFAELSASKPVEFTAPYQTELFSLTGMAQARLLNTQCRQGTELAFFNAPVDEPQQPAEKPAEKPAAPPPSRAEKLLTTAAKAWEDEIDKGTAPADAIKTAGPKFEDAIKAADEDYDKVAKAVLQDLDKLKPDMDKHSKAVNGARQSAVDIIQKLAKDKQEKVTEAAGEYLGFDELTAQKKEIAAVLKKHNLLDAAEKLEKAVKARKALEGKADDDPKVKEANEAVKEAAKPIIEALKKLPKNQQQGLAAAAQQFVQIDVSDEHKKAVEATLKDAPGLTAALDGLKKVFKDAQPTAEKVQALQAKMAEAIVDRVDARMTYAEALGEAGDDKKAAEIRKQALPWIMRLNTGNTLPEKPAEKR